MFVFYLQGVTTLGVSVFLAYTSAASQVTAFCLEEAKLLFPWQEMPFLKCFMSCFSPALLCCEYQLQRDLEEQELPLVVTLLLRWGAHHTSQHVTMKEGQRASSLLGDQNSFSDFLKVPQKQGSLPSFPHGCNSAFLPRTPALQKQFSCWLPPTGKLEVRALWLAAVWK